MTDIALAIVIVALALITMPLWMPLMYVIGVCIAGVVAIAFAGLFIVIFKIIEALESLCARR